MLCSVGTRASLKFSTQNFKRPVPSSGGCTSSSLPIALSTQVGSLRCILAGLWSRIRQKSSLNIVEEVIGLPLEGICRYTATRDLLWKCLLRVFGWDLQPCLGMGLSLSSCNHTCDLRAFKRTRVSFPESMLACCDQSRSFQFGLRSCSGHCGRHTFRRHMLGG